ncbi:2-amino-3,7-dideoxy-D-threo-hept-6-ulosonate synthase [Rhodococcus sp. NPDC003318]|uniref:2-amino-3,7-dideoxy-D-threo-hept-6-ulosonate synthase n=1 Tax=Rhodococcus sp. NPDC003318 TaxID=3364503 RepID=UPI0036C9F037
MFSFPTRTRARSLSGKGIRMSRITDHTTGRTLIVPMDHSVTVGPLGDADHADTMVRALAEAGANAVVLHRGRARHVDPSSFSRMGLIVHLSAGTTRSMDLHAKVLVSGVDDALRIGADAVSVHVNIGSPTEREQLADLGAVSRECEALGAPLLVMMYARGPLRADLPPDPRELAHLAAIATDLGADLVKLDYSGDPQSMRRVVESCPIPICVAGGPSADHTDADEHAVALGSEILASGVAGLSFGRNVFEARDPYAVASTLARLVHSPAAAVELESA